MRNVPEPTSPTRALVTAEEQQAKRDKAAAANLRKERAEKPAEQAAARLTDEWLQASFRCPINLPHERKGYEVAYAPNEQPTRYGGRNPPPRISHYECLGCGVHFGKLLPWMNRTEEELRRGVVERLVEAGEGLLTCENRAEYYTYTISEACLALSYLLVDAGKDPKPFLDAITIKRGDRVVCIN